jgi:hypothetical protein
MINFDILKEEYAELTGIEMFNEEGELQDFYREVNKIEKPICGIWHANPMPLTAVRKPFCGIATVDITVVSHPEVWETTRDTMNTVASALNGTSREITVDGTVYSISYNCQTCGIGNRILDANIGHGAVFEIRQQISYIIIESGVSAYDTFLYIDGLQIPFLSLVENKIHTTSNIASDNGVMLTASEAEAYGIDFVIPYMKDDAGSLVRDVIDRATGNEAHCVVLDIAGVKHCHIMQFTHVSANVQPPQNIGMNVSMTELDPTAAKYNGMWEKETATGKFATVLLEGRTNADAFVIFWGDGSSEYCENGDMPYHVYEDDGEHEIIVYKKPLHYYLSLEKGVDYFGKPWYFRFPSTVQKMEVEEIPLDVLVQNRYASDTAPEKMASLIATRHGGQARLMFKKGQSTYYIDKEIDGKYYILNGQKVQSLVDEVFDLLSWAKNNIFTSVWD